MATAPALTVAMTSLGPVDLGSLVSNALGDNPAEMALSFDSLMAPRIKEIIASAKIEVAQNVFGTAQAEEEEEQEEQEEELPPEDNQDGKDAQANTK